MRRQPVDLFIADVEMPMVGGAAPARRAREWTPFLPVLFLTNGGDDPAASLLDDGAPWAVLYKPFSSRALLSAVQNLNKQVHPEPHAQHVR